MLWPMGLRLFIKFFDVLPSRRERYENTSEKAVNDFTVCGALPIVFNGRACG